MVEKQKVEEEGKGREGDGLFAGVLRTVGSKGRNNSICHNPRPGHPP